MSPYRLRDFHTDLVFATITFILILEKDLDLTFRPCQTGTGQSRGCSKKKKDHSECNP